MTSRGALYAVQGRLHRGELARSVDSLLALHPDLPVTVYTDDPSSTELPNGVDVRLLPDGPWVASECKVWAVAHSPYEQTLYLDSDTVVAGDLWPLFDVLERYDLVVCMDQQRHDVPRPDAADLRHPVPHAQQTVNGGMLCYRANPAVAGLWADWWSLYQEDKALRDQLTDQPALRVALYRSAVRYCPAPPEYNTWFGFQPLVAVGRVRVVHGRHAHLDRIVERINASDEVRLWHPLLGLRTSRALRWTGRHYVKGDLWALLASVPRRSVRKVRRAVTGRRSTSPAGGGG